MKRTLRGKVAVAGIAETAYYRHGRSPMSEFELALRAVVAACEDAGISPHDIDGFSSYSDDRCNPSRLSAALGLRELRFTGMQWGGGGGGVAAAVGNAAAAIAGGLADCVVVLRALAQGQFERFGRGPKIETVAGEFSLTWPYGLMSPAQRFAMKVNRFMHEHGGGASAMRAIALASYRHAQANPRAVMHGRPLDEATYDAARWIVEPFRLHDCCMENDGAAALVLVPAERAQDFPHRPCYLLGAASGSDHRSGAWAHNATDYASASFGTVAPHLWRMAELGPADVDVLQSYENFTGGVMLAMVEHGFCAPDDVDAFFRLEHLLAPDGRLPLNTSGGNLAECYMHGLELVLEAVRQVRGTSTSQVPRVDVSMVIGGPMTTPVSSMILGSEATL